MSGEYRCGHDEAQQVNSSRSYDSSVGHRDAMAASAAYAGMFVSRVYTGHPASRRRATPLPARHGSAVC